MTVSKAAVGYLHPGEYSAVFAESLLRLVVRDLCGEQRLMHPLGKLASLTGAGGIPASRNRISEVVADSDVDWLLMVDSDMGFDDDLLERLIESAHAVDRPVVGALCFARKRDGESSFGGLRFRATPTLYTYVDGDRPGFLPMFNYPPDQLVQVAATGAACVLIHRRALEVVRERFGPVWFDPIRHPSGVTFSEDLSFCVRCAAVDVPMFVDTSIKTTHDKGSLFLDEDYYRRQEAARGGA